MKYIEDGVLLMSQDNLIRLQRYGNATPDTITVPIWEDKNITYTNELNPDTPPYTKCKKYKFAGMIRVYKEEE